MQDLPEPSAPTNETQHRQQLMQDLPAPSAPTTDTYASSNRAHSSADADIIQISGDNASETSTSTHTGVMSSGSIGGANSSNLSTSAVVRSLTLHISTVLIACG
jgi:hypothetical protein